MRLTSVITVLFTAALSGVFSKPPKSYSPLQSQQELYNAYADLQISGDELGAPALNGRIKNLPTPTITRFDNFALLYTRFVIETEEDKTTNLLSKGINYPTRTEWSEPTQIDYDVLLNKYKWPHIWQVRKKMDSALGVMAHYFSANLPDSPLANLFHNMIYNTKLGMFRNYYLVFDKQYPLP